MNCRQEQVIIRSKWSHPFIVAISFGMLSLWTISHMHQKLVSSFTTKPYSMSLPLHMNRNTNTTTTTKTTDTEEATKTTVLKLSEDDKLEFRALSIRASLEKDLPFLSDFLTNYYNEDPLDENTMTPRERALNWMVYKDTSTSPDRKDLHQRYILAVLFFSTTSNMNTWKNGDLHFLSSLHECHWHKSIHRTKSLGVHSCNGEMQITDLFLPAMKLSGAIPEELGYLPTTLTHLDLQNNQLQGTIPTTLGYLTNLEILSLNHNSLNGTLPTHLGQLTRLDTLYLQFNNMHGPDNVISTDYFPPNKKGTNMWTDCGRAINPITCSMCTVCCDALSACNPQ